MKKLLTIITKHSSKRLSANPENGSFEHRPRLILAGGTFLQSFSINQGRIKLFFGKINADKDFFHTFVFVQVKMKELANSCMVLDSK